jgi:hypothetical protein
MLATMTTLRLLFSAASLSLFTAWSGLALADLPPPDACEYPESEGAACNNAGPDDDQPGVCAKGMCGSTHPTADGGLMTTYYACLLCQETSKPGASSSGATSSGTTSSTDGTSSGTTGAGGGSAGAPTSGGGSSCAVGAVGREGMIGGTMALVGLGVILLDRRRRRG